MEQNNLYNFTSIGSIRSCYKEKFGIPRQPALVASPASIEIDIAYSKDEAFRELETFSHIWVVFVFHGVGNKEWNPTVRPPRLGGNKRIGVFASRSMFRPNPIGLSVVELKNIERRGNKIILNIIGGDFLDATPVLDIKPYIPYADSIDTIKAGYAVEKPETKLKVDFSEQVKTDINKIKNKYPEIENVIIGVLQLDPRPAYQEKNQTKNEFSIKMYEYDVKWVVENECVFVTELILLD